MFQKLLLVPAVVLAVCPMPAQAVSQSTLIRVQEVMEGKTSSTGSEQHAGAPKSIHEFSPHFSRALGNYFKGAAVGGGLAASAGFLAPKRFYSYYQEGSRPDLTVNGLVNGFTGAAFAAFTYSYLRDKKVKPYLAVPLSFAAGMLPLVALDINKAWGQFLPGAKSYIALGALGTLAGVALVEFTRNRDAA